MEMNIDLHGLTVDQAKYELINEIEYANNTIWRIRVIHGYNKGTAIRDMIWRLKHYKIKNIIKGDINEFYKNYEICKSCNNCMEMKNGTCFGSSSSSSVCDDYRYSPEISKDELDRWPKIGDALSFKFNKSY